MAKSPEEMKATMIAGLKEKTGKSLEEWLVLLRTTTLVKHKELVTFLKTEQGLTHGFANMIALQALNSDSQTISNTDSLIDAQYAGAKTGLRPIYEAIISKSRRRKPTSVCVEINSSPSFNPRPGLVLMSVLF